MVHLIIGSDIREAVRDGVRYELDLSEGIDLSVFLFGSFQRHIFENKLFCLSKDAVVFDIGANCGIMTLQFAKRAPSGKVYAFEPTHYAFTRLKKNLQLNPQLAERVEAIQAFMGPLTTDKGGIEQVYASWKVGKGAGKDGHKIHGGRKKQARGVSSVSLDDFCLQHNIERVDLIKIDTDGYEFEVLKGAREAISKFGPAVIFEAGIYLMKEAGTDFSDFLDYFEPLGYRLFNTKNGRQIDADNYRIHIPARATIDILALRSK